GPRRRGHRRYRLRFVSADHALADEAPGCARGARRRRRRARRAAVVSRDECTRARLPALLLRRSTPAGIRHRHAAAQRPAVVVLSARRYWWRVALDPVHPWDNP